MFFCVSRLLVACVGAALIMGWSRPASAQEKPSEETRTGIELVRRAEKEAGSFAWSVYPADTQELVTVKQGRGGFLLEKQPPLATRQDSWGFIPLAPETYLVEVTVDDVTRTLKKVEVEPGRVQKLSVAEDFGLDRNRPLRGKAKIVAEVATSPLYPITSVGFYLDDKLVGTVHEGPFHLQVDTGSEPQAHEIRVVAHNSAGLEATDQLETVLSRGPGPLRVVTAESIPGVTAPSHFELVLDASGSMIYRHQKMNGRLKMDVAKDVMVQLIHGLPDEAEVALRVYGHRIREGHKGDCQDSELVVPFGKTDKPQLVQKIRGIRALGTTPLAHPLWQAGLDVVDIPGQKHLILVTDGKEECGGRPPQIASQLVRMGIDVRLDVVGFALAEEATKQDMQRIAEITGGKYFDAQDAEELLQGIQHALAASYDVLDAQGTIVSSGRVEEAAITVPEGSYTIVVQTADGPITISDVQVVYNKLTKVELKKEGQEIVKQVHSPNPIGGGK